MTCSRLSPGVSGTSCSCLVEGAGRKEIAERLQLSANTVRTHLHSLMVKFGVHSTLEVVALARPRLGALPQTGESH